MAEVSAWQQLYASVEREQSPHDREGFQTLFYSRSGLTESEVREMEARLVYFPSDVEAVKRLFCTLSTGKIMVAQVVHLTEPDRLGRRGRYLAHSLVFEPETFKRIESDPFLVFRRFPFITTIAQALEAGDWRTSDVPPATFEVTREPTHGIEAAKTWPLQSLKDLALLALRAERLASSRLGIAFVGEPAQVESALEAAFFAVPSTIRPKCSFDTYFHGCNLVDSYYWATGLLRPPSNRRLITVHTQSQRLERVTASQPETAYERWVVALIERQQLETVAHYRDYAFSMCEWLEGRARPGSLIDRAPSEVADSVFEVNQRLVPELLRSELEKALPAVLASRVSQYLGSHVKSADLFDQLQEGFSLPRLTETLVQAYESQGSRAPRHEEIQAIDWLLQRVDHASLRLLYACWTNRQDELHRELQLLDKGEYQGFVQTALRSGIVEPWALPVPGRGDIFLDLYLATGGLRECELAALVRALLRARETSCLSRLTPYVKAQPEQELRALEEIVARQPDTPGPFRRAVADAVAALPPPKKGLVARLLDL
jgi:hypothetical protein